MDGKMDPWIFLRLCCASSNRAHQLSCVGLLTVHIAHSQLTNSKQGGLTHVFRPCWRKCAKACRLDVPARQHAEPWGHSSDTLKHFERRSKPSAAPNRPQHLRPGTEKTAVQPWCELSTSSETRCFGPLPASLAKSFPHGVGGQGPTLA